LKTVKLEQTISGISVEIKIGFSGISRIFEKKICTVLKSNNVAAAVVQVQTTVQPERISYFLEQLLAGGWMC